MRQFSALSLSPAGETFRSVEHDLGEASISGNESMIARMTANLISNAVLYSRDQGDVVVSTGTGQGLSWLGSIRPRAGAFRRGCGGDLRALVDFLMPAKKIRMDQGWAWQSSIRWCANTTVKSRLRRVKVVVPCSGSVSLHFLQRQEPKRRASAEE